MRNMFKAICIFTLVFFVLSMTGAACGNDGSCKTTKAIKDSYNIKLKSCPKTTYCFGTVLKNDQGCNLKVTSAGCITTAKGGKVCMKSNGTFCYKPASKKSCTDSFKYCIKGKDGKTSCTTVTLKLTCPTC